MVVNQSNLVLHFFSLSLKGSRKWIIFYYRICFSKKREHIPWWWPGRIEICNALHLGIRPSEAALAVGKDFRKWFRGWVSSSCAGSSIKCAKSNPQASQQVFQSTFRAGSILQIAAQIMAYYDTRSRCSKTTGNRIQFTNCCTNNDMYNDIRSRRRKTIPGSQPGFLMLASSALIS